MDVFGRLTTSVRELLTARNMAHIGTLMSDGAPQVSPVWIDVLDDDRLVIFSAVTRVKVRNLRRDPRIGISVADERNPYRRVAIRGRVIEEVDGEQAIKMMDRVSYRYTGAAFPERSVIGMIISPDHVSFQELPLTQRRQR